MTLFKKRISVFITIWLFAVWMLLFASIDPLTVCGGLFVALLVQLVFPLPHSGFFSRLEFLPTVLLLGFFLRDVILAALVVARAILTDAMRQLFKFSSSTIEGAVVTVPLKCNQEIVLAMTAGMINLIPGTIVLELDVITPAMTLHVFDINKAGGLERVAREVQEQEARLIRCFTGLENEVKN